VPEATRILLYGLLATASPTTLLATLVVLASRRGRTSGVAFAAAFVLGTAIAFTAGPDRTHRHQDPPSRPRGGGGAPSRSRLLLIAARQRHPHRQLESAARPTPEARFKRFAPVGPAISFGIGLPLGVGAKRLAITLLAATTVAVASLTSVEEAGLEVLYVVVATLIVWVPVTVYLALGTRADDFVVRSRKWITAHEQQLTVFSLLVLGVLLVGDGLIRVLHLARQT
jgi:hypothetical protein